MSVSGSSVFPYSLWDCFLGCMRLPHVTIQINEAGYPTIKKELG